MITEFIFVRHGETDANRAGLLQGGSGGNPLNAVGRKQAKAVAEYLRDMPLDAAYSSDSLRAVETAEEIVTCGHRDISLVLTDKLREWNCGEIEGWSWEKIYAHYPVESRSFSREQLYVQMPGGEKGVDFQCRIEAFITALQAKHSGKRILLVAHGGVLQRIFRMVGGIPDGRRLIPLAGNASVSTFIYRDDVGAWQLTSWNRCDHLKDIPQYQTKVL